MSEPVHRLHTLPPRFYSDETDAPFERCFDCGNRTDNCEDGYLIQKAYANGETIMEMAICSDCHGKLQQSYSKESRDRIWNFYLDHGDFPGRLKKFFHLPVGDPDLWVNSCMTCGATRESLPEYVVAAHVFEGDLVYGETPLMICFNCMNKIVEMLSEESRETYDRWMDRVLPPAPETAGDRPRVRVFM
jgi:hypothetical protein